MGKICKNCGTENNNNVTRCVGCGSPFFQNKLDRIERNMLDKL
jgi:uncharacterized membrane protein YvbJ